MHLKSLELSGFKSFARRTVLDFKTPITAIVGPNGSGKSNVSEALRFVLGEQSVKSMRGKRTEDLIWNGADGAPRGNRAAVKIVFDNSNRLFNLDFDEVSVERAAYRDGGSEYLLNGSTARLRDIHELLAQAHIGSGGHHIISQGEADRILNASPKERREMIEDALGLKIWEWKRVESEKKLEQTRENMKQVEALRREITPHLSFLKKQAEKIEKAKQIKGDLAALYREYFAHENAFLESEKRALADGGEKPRRELAALEKELAEAEVARASFSRAAEEASALARELGRLEGESAALARAHASAHPAAAGRRTVPLVDVEDLVRAVENETLLDRVKTLVRGFLEKYRHAPTSAVAADEKRTAEIAEKKQKLQVEIAAAEKRQKEYRESETAAFRILARKNELQAELREMANRQTAYEHAEADFKRELHEAGVVAGREAVQYETLHGTHEAENRTKQEERRRAIERLKIRIEDSGTSGAEDVLKEYTAASEREAHLARELADLEKSAASLTELIAELKETLAREFAEGLSRINAEFQKHFSVMFGGGSAKIAVAKAPRRKHGEEEEADESEAEAFARAEAEKEAAEEGVEVEVSIPRKKIKGLVMLSGGERALTSIALIFALSSVKPPPFIVLDETDAALDEANSKKYGDMIENLSKHSQLILITHNRETMSRADVLYGVTMERGASRLLSIAFEDAAAVAK